MSHFEIVKKWLQMPGLDGLFNKLATVLLLIAPLFIRKFFNQRQHWLLYTAMVLQMLLLFMLSPQYRFFFNFVLLFSFLTITPIIKSKVSVNILLGISIIASAIVLLVPMNFAMLTQNELAKESQTFTGDMMVNPSPNSKSISSFEKISDGNLDYYSPAENSFLWQTGNGALPCVNKHQVGFFDRYFNAKPQLIKSDVGDGFYSKQTR